MHAPPGQAYIKGNFKLLYNNKVIDEDTIVSKKMIKEVNLCVMLKGNSILYLSYLRQVN
jgi:hypothetical protein